MKPLLVFVVLLTSAYCQTAEEMADGIYWRAEDGQGPVLTNEKGKKISIGKKTDLTITSAKIQSDNNENTRFQIELNVSAVPAYPSDKLLSCILVVSGKAYSPWAAGGGALHQTLNYDAPTKESGREVANYLKKPICFCHHPGHKLLVSFVPSKQEFKFGEPVLVTLHLKNLGDKVLAFRTEEPTDWAAQYIFTAHYDYDDSPVKELRQAREIDESISGPRKLKPDEEFTEDVNLSRWFAFDQPGFYRLHGAYQLNFEEPDSYTFFTIWRDYASADFVVNIAEKK